MRSFALASIAAMASASHEFFAESNLICGLCTQVMQYSAAENKAAIETVFSQFPKLEQMFWKGMTGEHIVLDNPVGSCYNMGLCQEQTIADYLINEKPIEFWSIIEEVNNTPNASWTAGENIKFDGATRNDVRKLMGTVVDPDWTVKGNNVKTFALPKDDIPTNFDSRENWPECASVIGHIRDQSECGSCWAHGTTEAFNDRLCIATGGSFTDLLSVSDTTGCCNGSACFSFGCNGGQIGTPWAWFDKTGVVTGGDYGDGTLCYDYTMEKCAHHVTSDTLPPCDDVATVDPTCNDFCATNGAIDYSSDKHMAESSFSIYGIDAIKTEIMTNGPITGAFTVYEDFETYTSGVYVHTTGSSLGGHAIKVIGFGYDEASGLDYWLCNNSWNDTWGDKGTFKISIADSCGMNHQMHAGLVSA